MNTIPGQILSPDGTVANMPSLVFTPGEAALFRSYKKLLAKYQLREALYCNQCWDGSMTSDGCQAFVTDQKIGVLCRCTMRVYEGQTI